MLEAVWANRCISPSTALNKKMWDHLLSASGNLRCSLIADDHKPKAVDQCCWVVLVGIVMMCLFSVTRPVWANHGDCKPLPSYQEQVNRMWDYGTEMYKLHPKIRGASLLHLYLPSLSNIELLKILGSRGSSECVSITDNLIEAKGCKKP